jgi:cell division transport system ATP-binding protein
MIKYKDVSKIYNGESTALDNVNLLVEPEEFVSIVGHSGAGKTTLMKLLLAEERPTEGNIYFESLDVNTLDGGEINDLRRRIGTVFQDYRLLTNRTAYGNIAFVMEVSDRSEDEIEADVPYALELVGLAEKSWNFPKELSGGEKQRLAIARAIITQPDVIIADEPTGNLDPINTREVINILKKINDLGTTVILTTHDRNVVDMVGGRVITMDSGRIVRDDMHGKYVL